MTTITAAARWDSHATHCRENGSGIAIGRMILDPHEPDQLGCVEGLPNPDVEPTHHRGERVLMLAKWTAI
ncbi:MAG: hypothetical protein WCJ31_17575 [Planctomycetia bacterium]